MYICCHKIACGVFKKELKEKIQQNEKNIRG